MTPRQALLLLLLAAGVWYVIACRWWPFTACLWCQGDGKRRSPSGRAWRRCQHCKGTGQRLRFGRWVVNHYTTTTRAIRKGE